MLHLTGYLELIATKLNNFMTKTSSRLSVKFFQDVAQRFPEYMVDMVPDLLAFSNSAVNGYRKTIASDLLLKIVKSGLKMKLY